MKLFNHPATYALLTLFAVILLGRRFNAVPASFIGWTFVVVTLIFLYFILLALYNWIAQDVLPAWRRRRRLRKGGPDA